MTSAYPPALLRHLARLGDAIGSSARPGTLVAQLESAVAGIRALFGAAACSCALVEPDGESIRFVAADGAGSDAIVGMVMGTDRGIAGWVAMAGQAIVVADVRKDPRFARDVAESTSYVPTSIMAAPLLTDEGDVLGVLEVLDRSAGSESTGRDLDVLALLGGQLAAVVGLASVYDRLGGILATALAGAGTEEEFDRALADQAGDDELGALARTIADLSALGPRGRVLARDVLGAVLAFAARR
jgi:signal transduction protein with GAF and PtsI domain